MDSCRPSINKLTAFNVIGTYQLIWYSTATMSDVHPLGTIMALAVDENLINLVVKGQSGKININYAYSHVLVTNTGNGNSGQSTYNLTYKKHSIGSARVDGVSRTIRLNPTAALRIEGVEL